MKKFIKTLNLEQNKVIALFIKAWTHKLFRVFVGGIIGASIGWLYWEFIGCNGGRCLLTSSAPKSMVVFALFGMWFNYIIEIEIKIELEWILKK